jgi:FlaG/FlaF family flagellin (archaellin)
VHLHLRVIAVVAVTAGLIGAVLALTVLNTNEGSNAPKPGEPLTVTGDTGGTGEGTTLDYAQAIPLPINGPLLGVNLTAYSSDGYSQPVVKQDIKTLADLGSTAITLVPTWYMQSPNANQIAPQEGKSPSDDSLVQVIKWIREQGMQVILKPHVDVIDDSYRGDIQPSNRDAWFRSYGSFIDHYASFASSQSLDLFVVGTELKTMSSETERWRALIQTVRDRFMGPVTYAANWDELDQVQFWDDLDAIGVDAYYPLSEAGGPAPTLQSLTTAWRQVGDQLRAKSEQWQRPVILTEVGFPSQVGATATPYEVTDQPADQNIQALAYRATFDGLSGSDWLKGISWWSWRADPSAEEDKEVEYTPEGKKAQGELAAGQFTFVQ